MLASTKNRSVMDVTDTFSACWRNELWRETRSPSIEIGLEDSNADRFDHAPKQFFSGSSGHADKGPPQGAYRFEVNGIPRPSHCSSLMISCALGASLVWRVSQRKLRVHLML